MTMASSIKIVDIIFVKQPPTPEMFHRPYESVYNEDVVNVLDEATRGGKEVTPQALAPVSGMVLRPQAQTFNKVGIAGGFNTDRFLVAFVILVEDGNLMSRYEVVHGYTDMAEVSMQSGIIDPETRIVINNTTSYSQMHPMGNSQLSAADGITIQHSTQVLTPLIGWNNNADVPIVNTGAVTMRPTDVFTAISTQFSQEHGQGSEVLHDTRTGFGARPKRSYRSNNQNNHYLHRFLGAYAHHAWAPENEYGLTSNQFEQAAGAVAEPMAVNDAFIKLLTDRTAYASEWSVQWSELLRFDPTLATRRRIMNNVAAPTVNEFANWNMATMEAQVAQMVANLIPAMMINSAVGMLAFTLTNKTAGGVPFAAVLPPRGLTRFVNVEGQRDAIAYRLTNEIMPQLSNNGAIVLEVQAEISLATTSKVTVSVNGGIPTPFHIPQYCDSLFSPVISNDPTMLNAMARDLGTLAGELVQNSPRPPITLRSDAGMPMHQQSLEPGPVLGGNAFDNLNF